MMHNVYDLNNATDSLPPTCLSQTTSPQDCMFAIHAAPHVSVPMLILQSRYDKWQVELELGYEKHEHITMQEVNEYSLALKDQVLTALTEQGVVESSVFLDSRLHHTLLGESGDALWTDISVNGTSVNIAVNEWMNAVLNDALTIPSWVSDEPMQKDCTLRETPPIPTPNPSSTPPDSSPPMSLPSSLPTLNESSGCNRVSPMALVDLLFLITLVSWCY